MKGHAPETAATFISSRISVAAQRRAAALALRRPPRQRVRAARISYESIIFV
jgi:hypothetical protein